MGAPAGFRGSLNTDERALLARLVETLGPRLLAYSRQMARSEHDAEEVVAEAFCRAAANIAVLRTTERQDLYLLTVARNLCRDRFRRRRGQLLPADRVRELADACAAPQDSLARMEQSRFLRAAVAALPEKLREVVVLRLSTDLRFEEIADLLQIPLGTALSRMHAALQDLRKRLGTNGGC